MSTILKLELSDKEKQIVQRDCPKTWQYLLSSCNEERYYISKAGYKCFPVKIGNASYFICFRNRGILEVDTISFSANNILADYSLDINNGLLPVAEGNADVKPFEVIRHQNIVTIQIHGRVMAQTPIESSFGGGHSCGISKAVAKIFNGEGADITEFDIAKIDRIVHGHAITKDGFVYGTNQKLVSCEKVNNSKDDGYHLRTLRTSIGFNKKNPLYSKLFEGHTHDVLCHYLFTTGYGKEIYEIDELLD